MDTKSIFLGFVALLWLLRPIVSQLSIPPVLDGFRYGEASAAGKEENEVLIEAFYDPVCPDSRDSWPPLKQAVEEFSSRVRLVVHTFPLPYHDNSFATSKALHIANKINSSTTFHVLEAFFHHQELFYGKVTFNKSKAAVRERIVDFTAKTLGSSSYRSAVKSGFNDTSIDNENRYAFKYGCVRGVYATPFFFVNGFPLADTGSALNYEGWRRVLDPLISKEGRNRQRHAHSL
ncbi:hypothetical protein SASPL_103588 [Salvia splendens]|uniref:Thioredoxin-like fold domain-containing protein n=1 Tax=Salvia splendens TaxID=180675 RepID=A0A8X8YFH2_SALSN|nr:uncharacterized protein LOC121770203 isoform X2 [Salvia splendens]KAG6432015.1 hypothetical protein SASPL_103588 [Salvia splendens]